MPLLLYHLEMWAIVYQNRTQRIVWIAVRENTGNVFVTGIPNPQLCALPWLEERHGMSDGGVIKLWAEVARLRMRQAQA